MKNLNVVFISHGGGPMPLLNDPRHIELVAYLKSLAGKLEKPSAILLISAHWEEEVATITASAAPKMIYDYSGFPPETYQLQYPCPGEPELAEEVQHAIKQAGIPVKLDHQRGYDHGLYVPLMLMYPDAYIPTIQLSLLKNLDAQQHLAIGQALQAIDFNNLLVIGSGFSFHNMREFYFANSENSNNKNEEFQHWLQTTVTDKTLSESQRNEQMLNWINAPHARYCHPREEHLLPLHICVGLAGQAADTYDKVTILNKQSSAFVWRNILNSDER